MARYAAELRLGPAIRVRGSSRRITIMTAGTARSADIRVINRRVTRLGCCPACFMEEKRALAPPSLCTCGVVPYQHAMDARSAAVGVRPPRSATGISPPAPSGRFLRCPFHTPRLFGTLEHAPGIGDCAPAYPFRESATRMKSWAAGLFCLSLTRAVSAAMPGGFDNWLDVPVTERCTRMFANPTNSATWAATSVATPST